MPPNAAAAARNERLRMVFAPWLAPALSLGELAQPLQLLVHLVVQAVGSLHGFRLASQHVDLCQVVLAQSELRRVLQVTHGVSWNPHGFQAHAVGGEEVGGGQGDARGYRSPARGAVAL